MSSPPACPTRPGTPPCPPPQQTREARGPQNRTPGVRGQGLSPSEPSTAGHLPCPRPEEVGVGGFFRPPNSTSPEDGTRATHWADGWAAPSRFPLSTLFRHIRSV